MARLTLTNCEKSHLFILERDKKAGLVDYDTDTYGNVYLAVHRKRRQGVFNYHKMPNGDYVAVAGTLIFRGLCGKGALSAIYEGFNGDIEDVRSNTLGCYLIAIKKDSKIYVFVDKYEVLQAYYHRDGEKWVISNSLSRVSSSMANPEIHEFGLIQQAFFAATLGNDTIFKGVHKLLGSEFIVIDLKSDRFELRKIPYRRLKWDNSNRSVDEVAEEFADMLKKRLEVLGKVFGNEIGIFTTGGTDNRTLLAGFLAVGVRPTLLYGVGNGPLTNTKSQDLEIVKEYANRFGLPMHIMDWSSNNEDFTEYFDEGFDKYGFYATLHGASRNQLESYGKIPGNPRLIETGQYGEALRNCSWINEYKKRQFSIDQFVRDFYFRYLYPYGFLERVYPRYRDFYSYIREAFIANWDYYGIDKHNEMYDVDTFQQLFDPACRDAETPWGNLLNQTTCSSLVYSAADLHEFSFDIPVDFKRNERFTVKVLGKLYPDILNVPFFSWCQPKVLDRQAGELVPIGRPALLQKLSRVATAMPFGRQIRGTFRPLYMPLVQLLDSQATDPTRNRDHEIEAKLLSYFAGFANEQQERANLLICDGKGFYDNPRGLVIFSQYMYYANKILNKE